MTRKEAIARVHERAQWYVTHGKMDYKTAVLRVLSEDEKLKEAYLGNGPDGSGPAGEIDTKTPPWKSRAKETTKEFVDRMLFEIAEEKSKEMEISHAEAFKIVLADPKHSYLAEAYIKAR